jgi:hypothetical protein
MAAERGIRAVYGEGGGGVRITRTDRGLVTSRGDTVTLHHHINDASACYSVNSVVQPAATSINQVSINVAAAICRTSSSFLKGAALY